MSEGRNIAVLGGGAWGTALAVAAHRAGNQVRLWARDQEIAAAFTSSSMKGTYWAKLSANICTSFAACAS